MEFEFKLWENGGRPKTRELVYVTINKECKIFFNEMSMEALGHPAAVALMFDERRKVIGVMPSAPERSHAYRLRPRYRNGAGRILTARGFLRHHSIIPTSTIAFPQAYVNKDGILILDMQAVVLVQKAERLVTSV